jgi:probable addiction module antidote protein
MAACLEAALEDGDAAVVAAALGDIARASGMTAIASETGLGRESLHNSLSPGGNPESQPYSRCSAPSGYGCTHRRRSA